MDFENNDLYKIYKAINGAYNKVSEKSYFFENITDTTGVVLVPSPGPKKRTLITQLLVTNASDTVTTIVQILDDTTVLYSGVAYKSGGGFSIDFANNPLVFNLDTKVYVKCLTTGANLTVSANTITADN